MTRAGGSTPPARTLKQHLFELYERAAVKNLFFVQNGYEVEIDERLIQMLASINLKGDSAALSRALLIALLHEVDVPLGNASFVLKGIDDGQKPRWAERAFLCNTDVWPARKCALTRGDELSYLRCLDDGGIQWFVGNMVIDELTGDNHVGGRRMSLQDVLGLHDAGWRVD